MRPYLIIDISRRLIFAVIRDQNGQTFPCSFDKQGKVSRYFSGECWIDLNRLQEADEDTLSNLVASKQVDISQIAGFIRPYDELYSDNDNLFPIRHPLYALSTHGVAHNFIQESFISEVSFTILYYILKPIMESVYKQKFTPHQLDVIAIIPSFLSRTAETVLIKTLRYMGFRRVRLFNPEIALAMYYLNALEMLELKMFYLEDDSLHIHKVFIEPEDTHIAVTSVQSQTIPELGGHEIVNALIAAFWEDSGVLITAPQYLNALNRSIYNLFEGIFIKGLLTEINLNAGSFIAKLNGHAGKKIEKKISNQTLLTIRNLKASADYAIPYGPFFMMGCIEQLFMNISNTQTPLNVKNILAAERAVYGIVNMLNWLTSHPSRRIQIQRQFALRASTMYQQIVELTHGRLQFKKDKTLNIRRILGLEHDKEFSMGSLVFDVLWGNNPLAKYNANLCTLNYEVTADEVRKAGILELFFDIKENSLGLKGKVKAVLNGRTEERHLRFPRFENVISFFNF